MPAVFAVSISREKYFTISLNLGSEILAAFAIIVFRV
jgi:hypothetical protein